MNHACFWCLLFGILWTLPVTAYSQKGKTFTDQEVRNILDQVDQLYRGESSEGQMTMRVKTAHYQRSMTMKMWSYGEDYFLIRILEPKKERGTATLKRDDQIYNYLPKVKRTLKIGSAMMGGSWMGSHFTNDDLVQSSRLADDYTFQAHQPTAETLQIELIPKKNSAVVWGKISLVVQFPSLLPMSQDYYDEDLKKVRTLTFSKVKTLGGRKMPTTMKIVPVDKPEEFTELTYEEMKFDAGIKPSFFSLTKLKSMR